MKKIFLGIIFIFGIGVLSGCMVTEDYDEYERKQFRSTDEISEIIAKDSSTNYSLQISDTEELLVEYSDSATESWYDIDAADGVLKIEKTQETVGVEENSVIITLPEKEYKNISIETSNGDITFENVGFAYNSGETVLRNVSFTAKQGEVTALIGPSGGGKSTAAKLAARFWDADKGRITVGGVDVKSVDPEQLLTAFSIVFQDVTLFNNTVMENIRIGRKDATDAEVMAAARMANCEEFVEKLPEKWNTSIGENGSALSGGERQRISIARAFLKNAPIILLDEATASLDVENETVIQSALTRLIKDKTVLLIAHRMRTVASADKVVVLSDGTVAEQGQPDKLLSQNGIYTRMVKLQTASQDWSIG